MSESAAGPAITMIGTGDVGPVHGPIEKYATLVKPLLQSVDLRFGNCERQYSRRGTVSEQSPHGCQPPEMAQIFDDCAFDVVTLANNHMYDFGPDALLDTQALMRSKGILTTGAGADLADARTPAIIERGGVRVGFLGYCSVLPAGGAAGKDKVGIAPLRVKTTYEPRGPHAPTRVLTAPDERDLRMIVDDVSALRREVDAVVVAFHWGVIWAPRIIADYQVTVAHACIDAGADLILGHHAHLPKAIEVYQGKAIFYSLSNFAMTKPFPSDAWDEKPWIHGALRNHTDQDPTYPLLPYGKDAKRSLVAKALIGKDGIRQVSFVPVLIDPEYRPEPLRGGDPRFDETVRYLDWASDGFDHCFTVAGDEVIVTGGGQERQRGEREQAR